MINKIYYVTNNNKIDDIINMINKHFYCCITRETIEMNCSRLLIQLANEPAIKIIDELLEDFILN